jgi:hypothetical protein
MKNNIQINKWNEVRYELNNQIFTLEGLRKVYDIFWNEIVMKQLTKDQLMLCQFKVRLENQQFRSITPVQRVTREDSLTLINSFIIFLGNS